MKHQPASEPVAAVVFESPSGTDGFLITTSMGPRVGFGRGGQCPIRFGYAPDPDLRLSRQAGAFILAGDRLLVESAPQEGHAPLEVVMAGRPPVAVPGGEVYGPGAVEFDVVCRGDREWVINVRVRSQPLVPVADADDPMDDPPTVRVPLRLNEHDRQVLGAYTAPLRAGRLEPSTHAEVAKVLCYSTNKVRGDLYRIWQQMVTSGLAVPDYTDKRVAVARAAIDHRIV
jgi:hypothetical protein